jgi:hypothetical protein
MTTAVIERISEYFDVTGPKGNRVNGDVERV